jgi:hypothetical protein
VTSSRDKLVKQAARFLEAGESVVAAAKFLPRGAAKRRAAGGLFGVIGVLAAGSTARSGPAVLGRPIPKHLALVVTNRRLLVVRLSEATDKVTELTHAVGLGELSSVRSEVGKSVGMKAIHIDISFADGSTAVLEAVRPNTKDGEEVGRVLSTAFAAHGSMGR